jgi:hypothetical protein
MRYYSETRGLRDGIEVDALRVIVRDLYLDLKENGLLTEWLGDYCCDEGDIPGTAGRDPGRATVFEIGRSDIWPPDPVEGGWSEDAIFDFLQFLGSKVSLPVEGSGRYHSFNNCGWHEQSFPHEPARSQFIDRVNRMLTRFGSGWEMKGDLEIVERAPLGLDDLLEPKLPGATEALQIRVRGAIAKYRRRHSDRIDRLDAVRDLGDVLEPLRKEATKHLSKDEADLFNILNNFGLRHNNESQKDDYDAIWLSGLFYHYLMMIDVLTHSIERSALQAAN